MLLELLALQSFAVSFAVRLLIMQEKGSHFGPFRSYEDTVIRRYFGTEGALVREYEQPVTLIERIRRRTPFNPYTIDPDDPHVWVVDAVDAEVWECPKCLTPWVALVFVVPTMLLTGNPLWIPLMWWAVAGGAYFLYSCVEHFWTYDAEIMPMTEPPDSQETAT